MAILVVLTVTLCLKRSNDARGSGTQSSDLQIVCMRRSDFRDVYSRPTNYHERFQVHLAQIQSNLKGELASIAAFKLTIEHYWTCSSRLFKFSISAISIITKQDGTHTPISLRESSPISEDVVLNLFIKASTSRWSVRNSWDIAADWSFVSSSAYMKKFCVPSEKYGNDRRTMNGSIAWIAWMRSCSVWIFSIFAR